MIGAHYLETEDCDFVADNVHKAIIKLHRLNRLQHSSSDDWAHSLLEATHDLENEKDQTDFLVYLANPGNYKNRKQLWNQLETWDKDHTDKKIIKACQHDTVDDDNLYTREGYRVGGTVWIEQGPNIPEEEEKKMDAINEDDEKKELDIE